MKDLARRGLPAGIGLVFMSPRERREADVEELIYSGGKPEP